MKTHILAWENLTVFELLITKLRMQQHAVTILSGIKSYLVDLNLYSLGQA